MVKEHPVFWITPQNYEERLLICIHFITQILVNLDNSMKARPKSFMNFRKLGVHIHMCLSTFVQNNVTFRKFIWFCDTLFSIVSSSTLGLWFSCCTWFPPLHFESPIKRGCGFMFHYYQRFSHPHWVLLVLWSDKNKVTHQGVPSWTRLGLVLPW